MPADKPSAERARAEKHVSVSKELTQAKRKLNQYQILCAELYQVAGVLFAEGLVPVLMLDKLSAGQRGLPLPKASLLPFEPDAVTRKLAEFAAVAVERERGECAKAVCKVCADGDKQEDGFHIGCVGDYVCAAHAIWAR